jgi:hypothetical protein
VAGARVAAAAAAVLVPSLLGCAGLVGPSTLHGVAITPDACGNYTVEVDAEAPGRRLVLLVDGREVERFRVDGRGVQRWLGAAPAGSTVTVTARLSDRLGQRLEASATATQPAYAAAVSIAADPGPLYAGQPGGFEVAVSDVCAPLAAPRYTLRLDGAAVGAGSMVPAARVARIELPVDVAAGFHVASADVTLSPYRTESVQLRVYVEPPCADRDADGIRTCEGDCDDARAEVGVCRGRGGLDRDGDGVVGVGDGGADCADQDSAVRPGHPEGVDADRDGYAVPDGIDNDCDGLVDEEIVADCDDTRAAVNPGARERPTPNELDDNCDGRVDEGTIAYDDDGDGYAEVDGDCDDANPARAPNLPELPDCRDQDCDGEVDEGVAPLAVADAYEDNDAPERAFDLGGRGRNRFSRSLDLVTRDAADAEWFRFYSEDGPFDSWGITATLADGAEGGRYEVSIHDADGGLRNRRVLSQAGELVAVGGRGAFSDSGTYLLQVRAIAQPHDHCPVTVVLSSR